MALSRYDFMRSSTVVDPVTGNSYPDALTFQTNDYVTEPDIVSRPLSKSDIIVFNRMLAENYEGAVQYDDIILTLNGYPHKNFMQEGDIFYFPSQLSIINGNFKK